MHEVINGFLQALPQQVVIYIRRVNKGHIVFGKTDRWQGLQTNAVSLWI